MKYTYTSHNRKEVAILQQRKLYLLMSNKKQTNNNCKMPQGLCIKDVHKKTRNKYTGIGGSKFQHPDEVQPQHYFELFWDSNVWVTLVIETYKYTEQEPLKSPFHICSKMDTCWCTNYESFYWVMFLYGYHKEA